MTRAWAITSNQLPPVVQVTMVAIDEASAAKLGNTTAAPTATIGLAGTLFTAATYPDPASGTPNQLAQDLVTFESSLQAAHMNFRVFQSEVAIRGAKWTTK